MDDLSISFNIVCDVYDASEVSTDLAKLGQLVEDNVYV
jgi:hypothetical protein